MLHWVSRWLQSMQEAVVAYFKVYPDICLQAMKNFRQVAGLQAEISSRDHSKIFIPNLTKNDTTRLYKCAYGFIWLKPDGICNKAFIIWKVLSGMACNCSMNKENTRAFLTAQSRGGKTTPWGRILTSTWVDLKEIGKRDAGRSSHVAEKRGVASNSQKTLCKLVKQNYISSVVLYTFNCNDFYKITKKKGNQKIGIFLGTSSQSQCPLPPTANYPHNYYHCPQLFCYLLSSYVSCFCIMQFCQRNFPYFVSFCLYRSVRPSFRLSFHLH